MRSSLLLIAGALMATGAIAQTPVAGESAHGGTDPRPAYLSPTEIAHAVDQLATLEYPATQLEIRTQLGIEGRNLPGMGIGGRDVKGPGGSGSYLQFDISDPDDPHRRYYLYVWFTPESAKLAGPAFAKGRVVGYAEIILRDLDTGATFVAQSSRYPSREISFSSRKLRKD